MRATVRLADGRVVEGDLVSTGHAFMPAAVNACAGVLVPWVYGNVTVQSTIEPTQMPPAAAACAGAPTSYWIATV